MTKQLNEEFTTESDEVARDVTLQLDVFGGFESQQKRIADLQQRVIAGRNRIKELGGRADVVRERVGGWEKAEEEWQEKTRKRLRILWMLMAVVALVLLGLMGFQYTPGKGQVGMLKGVNTSGLAEVLPDFERIGNKSASWNKSTIDVFEKLLEKEDQPLEEDPRLRLFDEL